MSDFNELSWSAAVAQLTRMTLRSVWRFLYGY